MSDSTNTSASSAQRLTRLKLGLAIGFGLPFALGVAYQLCALLGWSIDFGGVRFLVELGILGALLMLTVQYDHLPLGSLGVHRIRIEEIYFGFSVGLALILLSAAVAELLPHHGAAAVGEFAGLIAAMAPADSIGLRRAPIWLALLAAIAGTLAEEVAARGYAIRRLRAITGTTALAAVVALVIDVVARTPLWGLRYSLVTLPAEIALVALFIWRRNLTTCIVAHLTLVLAVFLAFNLSGPRAQNQAEVTAATQVPDLPEEMAIVELRRSLGQLTGPGSAAAESAQTLYFKHDYSHALEQIELAIQAEPKNRFYIGLRAAIRAAQDNAYGAIADYTTMIGLDPNDARVYRARAREYKLIRDFGNAAKDLDRAIALTPKDALNFEERASLHYRQQQYSEAIADLTTAISLDPSNRRLLIDRAVFYEHIAQHRRALDDCDALIKSDPKNVDGYKCRINVYLSMGNANEALAAANTAIALDPNDAELHSHRGGLEMSFGRWREAHDDFEKVASLAPDDPQVTDGVAWRLATSTSDEVRDGKAALALALRENEITEYHNDKYLETLAAAYAETGDTSSAVKWEIAALAAADATDPEDREAMRRRLTLFEEGRTVRENDSQGFAGPRPARVVIGGLVVLVLAVVGLVAPIYWSARWSIHRARRARPAAAA